MLAAVSKENGGFIKLIRISVHSVVFALIGLPVWQSTRRKMKQGRREYISTMRSAMVVEYALQFVPSTLLKRR